ncbi:Uncharacterised protein [Mycobacteroides abscessus subsp. abscessus]|nr:Uncharacterised protein [Mycobacteroides abscessus subsp. abscessus]
MSLLTTPLKSARAPLASDKLPVFIEKQPVGSGAGYRLLRNGPGVQSPLCTAVPSCSCASVAFR